MHRIRIEYYWLIDMDGLYDEFSLIVRRHCNKFDGSPVQTTGAETINQPVHPSGVGKLVATSIQWVTAVEDCGCKCVRPTMDGMGLCC